MKLDGWQLPLFSLLTVIGVAGYLEYPIKSSADLAAWVQAIGTIAAIVGAIWIASRQERQRKADDLAETRAFVSAVETELVIFWKRHYDDVGRTIVALKPSEAFTDYVPAHGEFMVYQAQSWRIGKMHDIRLGFAIVSAYASARSLVSTLQANNKLVDGYVALEIHYHESDRDVRIEQYGQTLVSCAEFLKKEQTTLKAAIDELSKAAQWWSSGLPSE